MIDLSSLAQVGAIGCILAWFLLQTNPRLERIERALDRQTRAYLLDIISRDIPNEIKEQARVIMTEIEIAQHDVKELS